MRLDPERATFGASHSRSVTHLLDMNRLLGLVALLALTLVPAASAQVPFVKFGVAGGVNFDSYSDVQFTSNDGEGTFDSATGYHIGVYADLALGPVGIRPGIYYVSAGELTVEGVGASVGESIIKADLSLIEIPVDLRYRVMLPLVQPYISAGPVFRIANQSGDDLDAKDFTVAGSVGIGTDIGVPLMPFKPHLEVRYQFGLDGIAEDFVRDRTDLSVDDGAKLSAFMIRVGVSF